jgi:hypothetical protein
MLSMVPSNIGDDSGSAAHLPQFQYYKENIIVILCLGHQGGNYRLDDLLAVFHCTRTHFEESARTST